MCRSGWSTRVLHSAVLFFALACLPVSALTTVHDVRLLADPGNDGDSFLVEADGEHYVVRLYFVDCPESSAGSAADARRVREQTRYFGLDNPLQTIEYGREATAFVEELLAEPFTIHTSFASALGRTAGGRIYAFVTLPDGRDLASVLVKSGYARAMGVGRQDPQGRHRDDVAAELQDLELAAAMRRKGVWADSEPDRLIELRAEQRAENRELTQLMRLEQAAFIESLPLNINTATESELQLLPGIGPVYAQRIVANRPYHSIDELLNVQGISAGRLDRIREMIVVNDE